MQGWKLFKQALRMVMGNWREVLRIFLVPSIMGVAVLLALVAIIATMANPGATSAGPVLIVFLGALVLSAILATWCIVAWHRFVFFIAG